MKFARRLLIVILMVALPVQGALASSRWLCVAMSHITPGVGSAEYGASPLLLPHGGDHSAHAAHGSHPASGHAMHDGHPSTPDHQALPQSTSAASGDTTGCNLCAACTLSAATPTVAFALAAMAHANAPFPALSATVPRFFADGLERPPRTI